MGLALAAKPLVRLLGPVTNATSANAFYAEQMNIIALDNVLQDLGVQPTSDYRDQHIPARRYIIKYLTA